MEPNSCVRTCDIEVFKSVKVFDEVRIYCVSMCIWGRWRH